jgi:hypothetical protein
MWRNCLVGSFIQDRIKPCSDAQLPDLQKLRHTIRNEINAAHACVGQGETTLFRIALRTTCAHAPKLSLLSLLY